MVRVGESAPSFRLPGVTEYAASTHDLARTTAGGTAVVLVFYPFDFSPVCTDELCALQDAEFFSLTDGVCVWAVSADSIYAHWAFAEKYGLEITLLSDSDGSVAGSFDVQYDEWEGHRHVPKRAVVMVDTDGIVRYRWVTEDPYERPDFQPVFDAVRELDGVEVDVPDDDSVAVQYEEGRGPGPLGPPGPEGDE